MSSSETIPVATGSLFRALDRKVSGSIKDLKSFPEYVSSLKERDVEKWKQYATWWRDNTEYDTNSKKRKRINNAATTLPPPDKKVALPQLTKSTRLSSTASPFHSSIILGEQSRTPSASNSSIFLGESITVGDPPLEPIKSQTNDDELTDLYPTNVDTTDEEYQSIRNQMNPGSFKQAAEKDKMASPTGKQNLKALTKYGRMGFDDGQEDGEDNNDKEIAGKKEVLIGVMREPSKRIVFASLNLNRGVAATLLISAKNYSADMVPIKPTAADEMRWKSEQAHMIKNIETLDNYIIRPKKNPALAEMTWKELVDYVIQTNKQNGIYHWWIDGRVLSKPSMNRAVLDLEADMMDMDDEEVISTAMALVRTLDCASAEEKRLFKLTDEEILQVDLRTFLKDCRKVLFGRWASFREVLETRIGIREGTIGDIAKQILDKNKGKGKADD